MSHHTRNQVDKIAVGKWYVPVNCRGDFGAWAQQSLPHLPNEYQPTVKVESSAPFIVNHISTYSCLLSMSARKGHGVYEKIVKLGGANFHEFYLDRSP